MRALKVIIGVLVAITALVMGIGLFLPKDYRVERSIQIEAPPELVFDQVNSFRNWDEWSPWLAQDPTIKNEFSGPDSGVGAKVAWTSQDSGEGSQTITSSERPKRIETRLDFGNMGQPGADFSFEPRGDGTLVTWGLSGTGVGALGGYFAQFLDRLIGPTYEDGLTRLKRVSEEKAAGQAPEADTDPQPITD
ncbi:MAG: SRPBCC family protein [Myxococcota bacterium]